jgi:hypothetical protein
MKIWAFLFAVPMFGAITVSDVSLSDVSHGTALVHFHVDNTSPNGDGTLWNYARICYATASGGCASGTGRKYMPTGYPNNQSIGVRADPNFRIILTGLPASTVLEVCPEVSNDKATWSTACTTITTPGRPAVHPVLAELPRNATIPTAPTNYTGFHAGASTGGALVGSPPYPVTSCANLQADINAARNNQTSFGTLITLQAGQANKCVGRFYPEGNPPDVRVFGAGSVSTSTNKITIASHGLTEGHGVQFSKTYSDLPGEFTKATDCTGIKPGQVYYAHDPDNQLAPGTPIVDPNSFALTCDYPYPQGRRMRFDNAGLGGNMFMAPYPRRQDQGGQLYPIVIHTSTPESQMPPPGTRINPSWSSKLAVIQPDSRCPISPCFYPVNGYGMRTFALNFGDSSDDGNRWLNANMWGIGLEIQSIDATGDTAFNPLPTWDLVSFKEGTSDNGLDRCYIHGQYPFPSRLAQGISWNGHNNAILNSYFDRVTYPFHDNGDSSYNSEGTQFIIADLGPGPYYFVNNFFQSTGNGFHFQAAGQNGFDTKIIGDVVIKRNTFTQNPPNNHGQYCYGNTGSDSWEYRNRQPLEFKGGYRALMDGNIFEYDCHWLASSAVALTSVTAGLMDLTFTNNTWRHVSSVTMMGSSTQGGTPIAMSPTNRYTYKNNLIWDVNGFTYLDHRSNAYPDGWRGWVVQTAQDGEDFIWDHNTVVSATGFVPSQFFLASGGAEGFQVTNNIMEAHADTNQTGNGARIDSAMNPDEASSCTGSVFGSLSAEALLKCDWRFPGSNITGNLVTSDSGSTANVATWWPTQKQPCNASNTFCDPTNLDFVVWTSPYYSSVIQDYRLTNASPYISGGTRPATDQLDQGADIDALERAQGVVTFTSAIPASTTASINFVAPDTQGCPVDVSSTDSSLINTFTRFGDTGGPAGPRTVGITGLVAHTDYYFRINCAVSQPTGVFHTN